MTTPVISCPHCKQLIIIEQINCKIFRHGVIKKTMKPLPPHLPRALCDYVARHDLIYGCGKPFWYDGKKVEKCGYI
jgi:hypothetical protein